MRRHASGRWREAFDGEHRFRPLSEAAWDNTQLMAEDAFLANLMSRSYIARLDAGARKDLISEVSGLLRQPDAPREADRVVVPMRTDVYWTCRRRRLP
jgi:hypothetical protein